jgi:hypothetical protein
VAIQHFVIADLSAITLNTFLETAHLYRRSIFAFAEVKDVKQTTTACRL